MGNHTIGIIISWPKPQTKYVKIPNNLTLGLFFKGKLPESQKPEVKVTRNFISSVLVVIKGLYCKTCNVRYMSKLHCKLVPLSGTSTVYTNT
jgi:hypothetical protein